MDNLDQTETPQQTPEATPELTAPAPAEVPVTVTKKAADMVQITKQQEGIDPSYGLRIAVRGGGCSGFEYALDFEDEVRDNDLVYEQQGLKVIVDPISARYLAGTEIDYSLGMTGAGFKFNNPNAIGTCGCGSSFTV
ncbi:MAG: iron-sulfur cluster insertion protein ErpA [Acidobacteriota bacterium]